MNLGYFLIFYVSLANGFLYNYPSLRGNIKLKVVIDDDDDNKNNMYWKDRIRNTKIIITDDNDGYWEERIKQVRNAAKHNTSRRVQRRKNRYMERDFNRQLNKYNYVYDDFMFEPNIKNKSNYSNFL
tara:strand:+ start:972 stop:1352 length:381 start_codon:yes stop_codon:yes gene_type:complete